MKTKTFIVSGLVGGIVDFLLGWVFYGLLFADFFPQPEESSAMMVFIFLGCLTFGFFVSYVYNHWAQIATAATGAKAGIIIGFFMGVYFNLFNLAMEPDTAFEMAALDVAISIVMTGIIGAVIGAINGKMNK